MGVCVCVYIYIYIYTCIFLVQQPPVSQGLLIIEALLSHSRRTTLGRTPLDEGSTRRRDLYVTTHNIHNRQTSISPAGFEPAIPVSELPQTHALDRTATVIDIYSIVAFLFFTIKFVNYNSHRKSNKMHQCIKILFRIYLKLNMFRATYRPSSGA